MSKVVLTYGTFDIFHMGHLHLLRRAKALGDKLIVGVSTDDFNAEKGKTSVVNFEHRLAIVEAIRYVDQVIPESSWEQKVEDIRKYNVDTFVIGNDWEGKFDFLKSLCEVAYLPRTESITSSNLRALFSARSRMQPEELRKALDLIYGTMGFLD